MPRCPLRINLETHLVTPPSTDLHLDISGRCSLVVSVTGCGEDQPRRPISLAYQLWLNIRLPTLLYLEY
jgi:hypothetical protein